VGGGDSGVVGVFLYSYGGSLVEVKIDVEQDLVVSLPAGVTASLVSLHRRTV
jgi:hypothetical protein